MVFCASAETPEPVVITRSIYHKRTSTIGRVRVTVGIAKERSVTGGCVEAAKENSSWVLSTIGLNALLKSANAPVAVFELPPILLKRAPAPVAVFSVAVLRRAARANGSVKTAVGKAEKRIYANSRIKSHR